MLKSSIARKPLKRARFFAEIASLCGISRREAFENYLAASIVFGQSVFDYLRKEYARKPGFEDWWCVQKKSDSLFQFFDQKRNFVLHQGLVRTPVIIYESLHIAASTSTTGRFSVKRNTRWYKRGINIILQDCYAVVLEPILKLHYRFKTFLMGIRYKWKKWTERPMIKKAGIRDVYFEDSSWNERPALELLTEYLDKLEELINKTEAKFGDIS